MIIIKAIRVKKEKSHANISAILLLSLVNSHYISVLKSFDENCAR